jgi:GNAT superfamily N-acetyltransferase/nitroimidazol reductase NimA-like FMN-containing flavoprotein (pyridoxamine 5'-phosphate oxidase superfamily)
VRHPQYRGERADAEALFDEAPTIHVAGLGEDGAPILRTVHGVVVDGYLAFHGSPKGEKVMLAGRPVVASAEVVVASIPSYFLDAERACPATTYYRSAHVAGTLESLEAPALKARALEALMQKLQAEGGYRPITADDPLYAAAVRGIWVVGVRLEGAVAKLKLGQNRKPAELVKVLEALWQRGAPGDAAAIEQIRQANEGRLDVLPAFLEAPPGLVLSVAMPPAAAPAVSALLEGQYWLTGLPRNLVERAHLGASAWVGLRTTHGQWVASARAISDGARVAWIYDVIVAPEHQRRGLATRLMRALLDHPAVRHAQAVRLGTRDAMAVYAPLGFREVVNTRTHFMLLERPLGP